MCIQQTQLPKCKYHDSPTIVRDELGCIDLDYYLKRGKYLRSEAFISAVKSRVHRFAR